MSNCLCVQGEGERSARALVVKAHTFPDSYLQQVPLPRPHRGPSSHANQVPDVRRVVLLVRHPLDAIWSEYQRRQGVGHTAQVHPSPFLTTFSFIFFIFPIYFFSSSIPPAPQLIPKNDSIPPNCPKLPPPPL